MRVTGVANERSVFLGHILFICEQGSRGRAGRRGAGYLLRMRSMNRRPSSIGDGCGEL